MLTLVLIANTYRPGNGQSTTRFYIKIWTNGFHPGEGSKRRNFQGQGRTSGIRKQVPVRVEIDGPPPDVARPGVAIDETIRVGLLKNVLFVGKPVDCGPEGEGPIFKVDSGGQHATRVKVQFGQTSINRVQVLSGLKPGDQVILSDTPAHRGQDRLRVQ